MSVKTVDSAFLDALQEKAVASERKRAHHTLHTEMTDPVHRFCVAAEPETVVEPHRHPGKWELVVILRGEIEIFAYDDAGTLVQSWVLSPDGAVTAVELPGDCFHRFVAKRSSVFMEIKPGPYTQPEWAPWLA